MVYNWRYISSYRLTKDDLERYLKKKFGNWDFYIKVTLTQSFAVKGMTKIQKHTNGDRYRFWIERDLTKASLHDVF
jgi:hypothetical protein